MLIGIRVAEFSLHGGHTTDTYLNHTEGIGPNNLTDFTICLRFNINFLKPTTSSLLSYSTFLEDNALNVELLKQSGGYLLFYVCKYIKREQVSTTSSITKLKKNENIKQPLCINWNIFSLCFCLIPQGRNLCTVANYSLKYYNILLLF